ncbi:MAG TPA: hypothetical protein VM118_15135, partial [Acidobacteriota bacterium]|nr:hypothetical protein [Acidobacteriota bacterium]
MSQSRWNPVIRTLAALLCCATGLSVACSESRDADVTIAVAGTVRDASGEPVPGARVAIAYQYDPAAPDLLTGDRTLADREWVIPLDLKEPTDWTLAISDYSGDHVRTFTGNSTGHVNVIW